MPDPLRCGQALPQRRHFPQKLNNIQPPTRCGGRRKFGPIRSSGSARAKRFNQSLRDSCPPQSNRLTSWNSEIASTCDSGGCAARHQRGSSTVDSAKSFLSRGFTACRPVESLAKLLPVFGTQLEMACIGNFLFRADAGALQYEVRDVHPPMFGAKTNQPGFPVADPNVESFGPSLALPWLFAPWRTLALDVRTMYVQL